MEQHIYYKEMEGDTQTTYTKFVYKGYLCVQQVFSNEPWEMYKEFIWDPTEPTATRPLCFRPHGQYAMFFTHDGNKNVSDLITVGPFNTVVAHYDYAPFGAVTSQTGSWASANPFRFSSEFHDDTLGLVYYNYRHYNPTDARWLGRDPVEEELEYIYVQNSPVYRFDYLGGVLFPTHFTLTSEIELQRDLLLMERHGINAKTIQLTSPTAFTRVKLSTSVECKPDEVNPFLWEGVVTSTLYVDIYIYKEGELVIIKKNGCFGTREDVLSHEREHANDMIRFRDEALLNSGANRTSTGFDSCEECMCELNKIAANYTAFFISSRDNYLRKDNGHGDPKFQFGGYANVESRFK